MISSKGQKILSEIILKIVNFEIKAYRCRICQRILRKIENKMELNKDETAHIKGLLIHYAEGAEKRNTGRRLIF